METLHASEFEEEKNIIFFNDYVDNYDTESLLELRKLSFENEVPLNDVLLIALNRYGIRSSIKDNRIRFKVKLDVGDEYYFLALGNNTGKTPFTLIGNTLYYDNEKIGSVKDIEKDTCTSTYFRNNKTHITLNSNSRSNCHGCKFCGTYALDADDVGELNEKDRIKRYIENLLNENEMTSLKDVNDITVCTGCFKDEKGVINHLILLREVLKEYDFYKKIEYIGSQIQTDEGLKKIAEEVGNFSLFITTEKFTNREEIMKPEKASLNFEKTLSLIDKAKQFGFETTILYILGLEGLDIFEEYMKKIAAHVNKFPIVQIYQNYLPMNEIYRVKGAKNIDYYLKARIILEELYKNTNMHPNSWENYRSLYYKQYQKKYHESPIK